METPRRPVRLQMQQQMLSIGDDYWVEDDDGRRVFHVDGKAMRLRKTWLLKEPGGREVARIRERKLSLRDKIGIDLGDRTATVTKGLIGVRDRFHVDLDPGDDLTVRGNIIDHEYAIEREGHQIAAISKQWFRVRDSYGVEVDDPRDVPLVLAVTVAVDAMSHDGR